MTPRELHDSIYEKAMVEASGKECAFSRLEQPLRSWLDEVVDKSENCKAVTTVLVTSITYKILHPEQDVRKHQISIKGGYAGRVFDTKYITPFLKEKKFPAMSESGWLTRSLEQKVPYNHDYHGAIKPKELKEAFLNTLDMIECGKVDCKVLLDYIFQSLIIQRERKTIPLATPRNLSISDIVDLLDKHFHHNYHCSGAARLPVVALYAAYMSLAEEVSRYKGKTLLPLESHTSADVRSGRMGDIDIVCQDGTPFEAVEVKFDVPVSYNIVETAKEKIEASQIERYYILSTKDIVAEDKEKIEKTIRQIKNTHGCQLVVNGIKPSLKYYLRLVDDASRFIVNYTQLLMTDDAVKFEHKSYWNKLVGELNNS